MGWGRRAGRPCTDLQAGLSGTRGRSYRTVLSWGVTSDDIHSLDAPLGKRCLNFLIFLTVESPSCCLIIMSHISYTWLQVGLGKG